MTDFHLSNFEIAERQLLQAITMFFRDEDPISIHTLAEAAAEIFNGAGGGYGAKSLVTNSNLLNEETQGSVQSLLSESKNFYRHIGQDPDSRYEFKPVFNHISLINAVDMYAAIKQAHIPETFVFLVWYSREYPNHLRPDSVDANTLEMINRTLPDQTDMAAWYNFIRLLRSGRLSDKNITLNYGL